ncbi:hypothetical protein AAZX31_11G234100 [Glycine max]
MTYVLSASAKANKMDTEMVESIDVTDDARSFSWAVDSAIRSETGSIFGESRVRSFASLVDSAIRSSNATEADLGSSPVHVFAMAEDKAELKPATNNFPGLLFTLAELEAATNNFSRDNMIGYKVYRGKLVDGREVAIKKMIKFRRDSFRKSEFAILSRLPHRNLVGLVGLCKNRYEWLLVYEYTKKGSLHDHLHDKNNVDVNIQFYTGYFYPLNKKYFYIFNRR